MGRKTHGKTDTRLFRLWLDIKSRCNYPKDVAYRNYGARGIKMCDEWEHDFLAFEKWALESGYDEKAPKGKCTIDRIDVNKNYSPSNCRWVDAKTQANNRRNNVYLTHNGVTLSASEWAEKLGINVKRILHRKHNGFTDDETLTIPSNESTTLTYNGKTQLIGEWAKELNVKRTTLAQRKRYGWDDEKILTTPIRIRSI